MYEVIHWRIYTARVFVLRIIVGRLLVNLGMLIMGARAESFE